MKNIGLHKKKLIISRTPDINTRTKLEYSKGYNFLNNNVNNNVLYNLIYNRNQIPYQLNNNVFYTTIQNGQNIGQINNINNRKPLLNMNYNINNQKTNEESNSDGKFFCSKNINEYAIYTSDFNYLEPNNIKQNQIKIKENINEAIYSNNNNINSSSGNISDILTQGLNQQILYEQNYAPIMQIQQNIPKKNLKLNEFSSPTKNQKNENNFQQRFETIQNENIYELNDIKFHPLTERKNTDDFLINYNQYILNNGNNTNISNNKDGNEIINTPVKEKNNFINIYNKFQSPIPNNLKEYYPEYKDNGYSSKPSKKVNIIQQVQYNTHQPKNKPQCIRLTQIFKNYNEDLSNIDNNQYSSNTSTPFKEEIKNNTPSSEKNYTTYTQPINTNENNMPKVAKNLFGKKISIKSIGHLSKGGKEEDGLRKINQDSYIALTNINNIKDFNIFAVLDGHGPQGHTISKYVAQALVKSIISLPSIKSTQDLETIYYNLQQNNFHIIKQIFMTIDHQVLNNNNIDTKYSGTTCLLIIILGNHIISANIGDSRGILVYDEDNDPNLSNLRVFQLSKDYKLDIPEERNRIINAGGIVKQLKDSMGVEAGPFRVFSPGSECPGLAMSRSIGDSIAKKLGVISEPGIIEYNLNDKTKFIILGSDGIWEFLDNVKVKNIGKQYYLNCNSKILCEELYSSSLIQWQINDSIVDDITVIAIFF